MDADTQENSVKPFNKLDWLPTDDIICIRKLCMLHKINQGHCPAYFNNYIEYILSNTHNYNSRSVSNNNITTPACKRNSGLKTFHSSTCRLWNTLDAKFGLLIIITIIIILKITYLNFTIAGIPSLIILRSVKLFNFISS